MWLCELLTPKITIKNDSWGILGQIRVFALYPGTKSRLSKICVIAWGKMGVAAFLVT